MLHSCFLAGISDPPSLSDFRIFCFFRVLLPEETPLCVVRNEKDTIGTLNGSLYTSCVVQVSLDNFGSSRVFTERFGLLTVRVSCHCSDLEARLPSQTRLLQLRHLGCQLPQRRVGTTQIKGFLPAA